MSRAKLTVGKLLARVEAPGERYRVTSVVQGCARLLPYQRQGREVWVMRTGALITGDGSVWIETT